MRRQQILQKAAEAIAGSRAVIRSSKLHTSISEVTGGGCYNPGKEVKDE